jgi:hypothetical protein
MNIIKFLAILILLISCAEKPAEKTHKYFDIKSLFSKQIEELVKEKPIFKKEITINAEKEAKDLSEINWTKELDPFLQSDINKPAFMQSYDIEETDSTLRYSLKTDEKLPISSILIMNKKEDNQLKSIEIISSDENLLYNWSKTLTASFENNKLQKYSVKGKQKILVFDEENYQIIGKRK